MRLVTARCSARLSVLVALTVLAAAVGTISIAAASPTAVAASQRASHWLPRLPRGFSYDNLAVSRTAVWVFADANTPIGSTTRKPGLIVELNPATGRRIRTLRERTPGQIPWVVAAYGNHAWTTIVPADGVPALAEVTATGAFIHRVNLPYGLTTAGPVTGAATSAGSHLWAATASPRGAPAGLLEISASNGARIRFLHWPRALRGFYPDGMAATGTWIWMTDGECQIARVAISSDQGKIFRLPPHDCQIGSIPAQIGATGDDAWVTAHESSLVDAGAMAELSAGSGLVRLIAAHTYGWDLPSFLIAGPDLWVASAAGGLHGNGAVTELNARTGRLVHFFHGRHFRFSNPLAIAAWRDHVWILGVHTVTEL